MWQGAWEYTVKLQGLVLMGADAIAFISGNDEVKKV